jgi:hypothetical protein
MTLAHFDGKFWMTGGMRSWDKFSNDVWNSANGTHWKVVGANAPWAGRRNHSLVVFDKKLWVIGGAMSSGSPNQTPTRFYNDVWSSADGVKWTKVTDAAEWSGRDNQQVLVFDNKLWLVGGTDHRDVWSSRNGKDWTRVLTTAPWDGRRGAGVVVYAKKMWFFGGLSRNDVWSSNDGKDWQKVFEPAPWSTRGAEFSVAFRDAIWIYGGKTGREDSWGESSDVWKMRTIAGTSFAPGRKFCGNISGPLWTFLFFLLR